MEVCSHGKWLLYRVAIRFIAWLGLTVSSTPVELPRLRIEEDVIVSFLADLIWPRVIRMRCNQARSTRFLGISERDGGSTIVFLPARLRNFDVMRFAVGSECELVNDDDDVFSSRGVLLREGD